MLRDPYAVLGVREGADMDEIKRAYRKKAKEYHPDLHPDDPAANEKMQQVNEAYELLCNPDKYRAARQAGPRPDAYGQRTYDGYARGGQAYGGGGWQYTYYTAADEEEILRAWQQAWRQAGEAQTRRRAFNPLRGVARVVAGLFLIRLVISFLRFMLFGFLG